MGKYMIRPVLALERLSFLEPEGKVGYRWGRDTADQETMDYLEFIARVTAHIPDKGQVMVRYCGLSANAHRGKVKKAIYVPVALGMAEESGEYDQQVISREGRSAFVWSVSQPCGPVIQEESPILVVLLFPVWGQIH